MQELNETSINSTILDNTKGIIIVSVWSTTLIIDLLVIIIEFKSRQILIRLEFFILLAISISSLLLKIASILTYIELYFSETIFGQHTNFILQWVSINFTFFQSMSLVYYSLYHITFLKRSSCFLVLFNLVHNVKSFVIYLAIISVYSLLLTSIYMILTYIPMYSSNLGLAQFQRRFIVMIILECAVPPFLASIVYVVAFLITYFSRFQKTNSSDELKRAQMNFKLMFKFLLLTLSIIMYILPKTAFAYIAFNLVDHSKFEFLNYIGDISFFLFPIILISIHEILFKTLMSYYNNIFVCRRK